MLKMKTIVLGLAISILLICSFMAGRAGAQQPLPTERMAAYAFPRAWGELNSVAASPRGLVYVFVASDGVIRQVSTNPGGPEQIEAIARR